MNASQLASFAAGWHGLLAPLGSPDQLFVLTIDWHHLIYQYSYLGLFLFLMVGIFLFPLPDETVLVFVGFHCTLDPSLSFHMSFPLAWLAAFCGSVCGITLSFVIGRTLGVRAVHRYGARVRITPERMARAHAWFERLGKWTLPIGYFIPGLRHVTAIVAGAAGLKPWEFCVFAYTGALLWTGTFITLGYVAGKQWEKITAQADLAKVMVLIALLAGVLVYVLVRSLMHLRQAKRKNNSQPRP